MVLLENKMFLEIDPPKAMSELIEWFDPAEQMPDSDTTVMVKLSGEADAWMGYHDGERWIDVTGFPMAVPIIWAHVPQGPAA